MINQYRFGTIIIDGKTYHQDVLVFDHEVINWKKRSSHLVAVDEIQPALAKRPEVIIFGTGESGLMEVHPHVQSFIKERGIQVIIAKSHEARKEFNDLTERGKKVAGFFHLTC